MTGPGQMAVPMPVEIEIQRATTSAGVPEDRYFQKWAEAALAHETRQCTLTIRIVDELEARQFNLDYRQRGYATNVLAFPADLPENLPAEIRQGPLGDILICAPVVTREAVQQHRPENDHWAHLTVHGILHLLGYDHQRADEAAAMESLETKILAKLAIPDPYRELA